MTFKDWAKLQRNDIILLEEEELIITDRFEGRNWFGVRCLFLSTNRGWIKIDDLEDTRFKDYQYRGTMRLPDHREIDIRQ